MRLLCRVGARMCSRQADGLVDVRKMAFRNLDPVNLRLHKDSEIMYMLDARYGIAASEIQKSQKEIRTSKQQSDITNLEARTEALQQLQKDWEQVQLLATDVGPYSYQAYISALLVFGDIHTALQALDEMRTSVINPTPETWLRLVTALIEKQADKEAISLFMKSNQFSIKMYNAVLPAFQRMNAVPKLTRLFENRNKGMQRDSVTFIKLVSRVRSKEEAVSLMHKFEVSKADLTAKEVSALLTAISKWPVPDVKLAEQLFQISSTTSSNLLVRNSLMSVYRSAGRSNPEYYERVILLYNTISTPSSVSHALLISTFAKLIEIHKHKNDKTKSEDLLLQATNLFNKSVTECPPGEQLFIAMLRCYIAVDNPKGATGLLYALLTSNCADSQKFREILFLKWKGLRLPSHIPTNKMTHSEQIDYKVRMRIRERKIAMKERRLRKQNTRPVISNSRTQQKETSSIDKRYERPREGKPRGSARRKEQPSPNLNQSPFKGLYEKEELGCDLILLLAEL
eukprot:TRINITY_DN8800_c0_g1_i1.p1 TRINITY_DN8800_c0_g1~~TRINITY_DN8800_c0_g1_i1.p1  ORF type:complete len:513 (+),score=80.59 TRINITY_DN8800_c0_g1_i1:66-1604(+)